MKSISRISIPTDEQIEDFYSTFKDKMPDYKKINPEVVDSLFDFIDFEKFKKSILLSKHMTDENFKKADRTAADMESNSKEAEVAFFKSLMEEELIDPWRQAMVQKEKDGISSVTHQRSVEGRPLNVVRSKAIWRDIDVELVWKAFLKLEKY